MPQTSTTNRRLVLAERPRGEPTKDTLRLETAEIPTPGPGQMLLRTEYLSLDPYMRGRMSDAPSYAAPVAIGAVMQGGTVARVVTSRVAAFASGDWVLSFNGWQDYALSDGTGVTALGRDPQHPSWALGILGMPGFTAWAVLTQIGMPKPGETLCVAAATGPVGATVGQIGKILGCHVVGIAGGPQKCVFAVGTLGFDACIDHKSTDFADQLKAATPQGIDIYFENVGGEILDTVLLQMNLFGRIPVCGLISAYNATAMPEGPKNLRCILTQRLKMQGLIVFDWEKQFPEAISALGGWYKEGRLKIREDVRTGGLTKFVDTMNLLYTSGNNGKLVLKV